MEIELICQNNARALNGIGRYTRELYKHLARHVSVRKVEHIYPPLAHRMDPLRYFPIGVRSHRRGSILHFMEDFGCSQMLWHPMHPAVATSHDLGFLAWAPEAQMHRGLDRLLLRLSYIGLKRMDAIITVSEYSRKKILQQLKIPAEQVFMIHSGNDNHHFRPISNARTRLAERYGLSFGPEDKILLYVGAEFPRKNLASILQTLKFLPSNIYLFKVGEPGGQGFRGQTKKLVTELELNKRVLFFNQVPEEDLLLFYNAANVYVCASYLEGFGHPILEAMACGTPVVCSHGASLPEITGDAAILLPPSDAKAFAEVVQTLLCDRALREHMIARGFKQAASFSWDRTAERVAEVYRLVGKKYS